MDICKRKYIKVFSHYQGYLYWLFWNAYTLILDNNKFKEILNENLEDVFRFEIKIGQILGLIKKVNIGHKLTRRETYLYHLIEQKY